jgi:ketosteroid isomerase-like protein
MLLLREYMSRMDSADPEAVLELLEPDFRFLIALPAGDATGASRDDFAKYLAGRNAVDRTHNLLRASADGDTETVYGVVTESGKPVGNFLSAAVISPAGRIARYQAYFSTTFSLVDGP